MPYVQTLTPSRCIRGCCPDRCHRLPIGRLLRHSSAAYGRHRCGGMDAAGMARGDRAGRRLSMALDGGAHRLAGAFVPRWIPGCDRRGLRLHASVVGAAGGLPRVISNDPANRVVLPGRLCVVGGDLRRATLSHRGIERAQRVGDTLLTGLAWQSPHYDIWLLPLSGERRPTPFLHSRFGTSRAVFSSDGRWVAYLSWESERTEVFVTPFPGLGPKWQISADGGAGPRWSSNGRELFYRNGDKMMAVEIETRPTFRAGRPRSLFEAQFRSFCGVDPEGKRFLMIKRDPAEFEPARLNVVLNWFEEVKRVPGAK